MILKIAKWAAIPALMIGSMFTYFAADYHMLLDAVICLGALLFFQHAVWVKEYCWAAGLAAIAVVFSPFALAVQIFLLMGLACLASCAALVAAFPLRSAAVPAEL